MTGALPQSARVVVIGGGVMGCSTLYHLAKAGVADAVLLERDKLTSGTTWHSAAQVRRLRSSRSLTRLVSYSAELYAGLEAETGQSTGWARTGSMGIAANADRWEHLRRQASLAHAFGIETQELSGAEAGRHWPLIRTDDLIGAVYAPDDGRVNPSDLCSALVKGAKSRGAKVFEDTPVTGFEIENGRVAGVRTAAGTIRCEAVALCSGLWSRQVGEMAGVPVPLYACEHFYLLTKPIPGVEGHLPTLGDHDAYLYMRDDVGGLLIGCFEPDAKPLPIENLPENFAFGLLNEDWDHFEPMMMNAIHRIPALETAEVRMLLNGPESFTPDGQFLLGESPALAGFFLGCGMNSVGVASGGGAGHALAHWVLEGEPPYDLWSVDIRRMAPFMNNIKVLAERIPEELGLHYAIHYPGRTHETARGLRRSPVHDRLAAKGAWFGTRYGWERAEWFAGPESRVPPALGFGRPSWHDETAAECHAAREGVALFDQTSFGKLLVQGPDAEAALQRLCAADVAVEPGRVIYTGLLNARGGYESDLTATRLDDDRFMLVTGTAQPIRDRHWIERNLRPEERVTVSDVSGAEAVFSVMGPRSRELLQSLTDADLSNDAFAPFAARTIALGHATVRAARLSYVGELGWELYTPVEMAAGLYDALFEAGAEFGLRDAGMQALGALRIEKGFRAWGHEVSPDDTPLEAGLGFATKLRSNLDFLGREALMRRREEGIARRLIHFTCDDPALFPHGDEPIVKDGAIVGQVTSAAFGHTIGRACGMGYVRLDGMKPAEFLAAGRFEIELACERHPVTVSLDAPYDPRGERMHG